jgi:A/G-specific adenine glycosylase
MARFHAIAADIGQIPTRKRIRAEMAAIIPKRSPGIFNQAVMELGALVCTPASPDCASCPLRPACTAYRTDKTGDYPRKSARKPPPLYRVSVAVIRLGSRFLIQKRPASGHLPGLWEFPGGKGRPGEPPEETLIRECREELGVEVDILEKIAVIRHAYTHFKIILHVYLCELATQDAEILPGMERRWISAGEIHRYPFPAANHKFLPKLSDLLVSPPRST